MGLIRIDAMPSLRKKPNGSDFGGQQECFRALWTLFNGIGFLTYCTGLRCQLRREAMPIKGPGPDAVPGGHRCGEVGGSPAKTHPMEGGREGGTTKGVGVVVASKQKQLRYTLGQEHRHLFILC